MQGQPRPPKQMSKFEGEEQLMKLMDNDNATILTFTTKKNAPENNNNKNNRNNRNKNNNGEVIPEDPMDYDADALEGITALLEAADTHH